MGALKFLPKKELIPGKSHITSGGSGSSSTNTGGKKREELGRKEIETYLSKLISKPNIKALQVGPARQHTSRTVFLHCSG